MLFISVYVLSTDLHLQEQLREEIMQEISGKDLREVTIEELNGIKLLNYVIKEGLRYYPPAWANIRLAAKDLQLGDIFFPKDSAVLIPILALHRDPASWGPTADQFLPERWDPCKSDKYPEPPRGAYIPFNIGPRDCIGARFANLEMKLVLASLLSKFSFTCAEGPTPKFLVAETLRPDKIMVHVKPLEN